MVLHIFGVALTAPPLVGGTSRVGVTLDAEGGVSDVETCVSSVGAGFVKCVAGSNWVPLALVPSQDRKL